MVVCGNQGIRLTKLFSVETLTVTPLQTSPLSVQTKKKQQSYYDECSFYRSSLM